MPLALDPSVPIARDVKQLARRQLSEAVGRIELLAGVTEHDDVDVDVEREIHEIRKRCKEVRAIARLVESAEGREARKVERLIRRAARRLSSSRDAAVLRRTLDRIAVGAVPADVAVVHSVAASFAGSSEHRPDPDVLLDARDDLRRARRRVKRWRLQEGDEVVRRGLAVTMRSARRCWIAAHGLDPEPMHAWRTVTKRWWYQVRLVQPAAPDVLDSIVSRLDAVGELLGDVHDLDVLMVRLEAVRVTADDEAGAVDRVVALAARRRAQLAAAAMRRAGPLFVEPPGQAARRLIGHWRLAVACAPEPDPLGQDDRDDDAADTGIGAPVERERKFVVETPPQFDAPGAHLRQGYLAVDGATTVRIRSVDAGAATLTVKVGSGTTRHEFERSIDPQVFDRLWPLTEGRRVDKVRHLRPLGDLTIEIDVFHDRLAGLVVAEVEFEDDDTMAAFEPPGWFGQEVSEDGRYTNARLAIDGLPDA